VILWITPFASMLIAGALAGFARHYAVGHGMIDHPNDRSSHDIPTPRGGGIGFVIALLICLAAAPLLVQLERTVAWAGLGFVATVAVIGWIDDQRSLSVAVRLPVHVLVGVGLGALAVWADTRMFGSEHIIVAALAWAFCTTATINVVNFMDGIDGLIGLQGVVFGVFALVAVGGSGSATFVALTLIGGVTGFLLLNWPPARIFMGDVGSGSLGVAFMLLGMLLLRERRDWTAIHAFLPLMPLFVDELLTMVRRACHHENILLPHREHIYQLVVRSGRGHGQVSLAYAAAAALCALWVLLAPRPLELFIAGAAILLGACVFAMLWVRDVWSETRAVSHMLRS
jgi:UDP-N-acetylmuramyl pentapeptide phosphotransferase/UDP-N-acetylglucosamine-1-phosphate transferase